MPRSRASNNRPIRVSFVSTLFCENAPLDAVTLGIEGLLKARTKPFELQQVALECPALQLQVDTILLGIVLRHREARDKPVDQIGHVGCALRVVSEKAVAKIFYVEDGCISISFTPSGAHCNDGTQLASSEASLSNALLER